MITVKGLRVWYTTLEEDDIELEYVAHPSFAELAQSEELSPQGTEIADIFANISWSNDSARYLVYLLLYPGRRLTIGVYSTEAQALKAARAASWRYAQVLYKSDVWRGISGRRERVIDLKWPGRSPEKRSQSLHDYSIQLAARGGK
jgi:hypothetical protein